MFCTKSENCINIDYTYCGPNQAFSVIDYFIISRCLSPLIAVYKTISSMSNISDHVPLFLDVEWHSPKITNIFHPNTDQIPNPLWARATQAQIEHYQPILVYLFIKHCWTLYRIVMQGFLLFCFFSYN